MKTRTTKTKLQPKPEKKVDVTEQTSEAVVETVEPTPVATPPNVAPQELQRLAQRVKTLETQTSAGVDVNKIASLEAKVKSLETQVNSFRSELNKITALESKLEDHVSAPSAGGSDPRVSAIVDVLKRALPGYSKTL